MERKLILSCEHAGNLVPDPWKAFLHGAQMALKTHRGFDLGAEETCVELGDLLGCPEVHLGKWSRLVVDLNRSEHHPQVFSQWTRGLHPVEKESLLASIHRPYRATIREAVRSIIEQGQEVVHLSIHSFTPILDGEVRNADIGLLYDPRRKAEQTLAISWEKQLEKHGLVVRRNYPYRGRSDGLTTDLRRTFLHGYLGFEIEVNQAYLEAHAPQTIAQFLAQSIKKAPEESGALL